MAQQQSTNSLLSKWLPQDILKTYSIYNYNHAAEILSQSFATELNEIIESLRVLTISIEEIKQAGGNESPIPPKNVNLNFKMNNYTKELFANPSDKGI